MNPVISSTIDAIGWENGTLKIRFKNGGEYHYPDVPKSHFDAMLDDKLPSVGKYFHKHIRNSFKGVKQ